MAKTVDAALHIFRSPQFESVVNEAINFFQRTPIHVLPPSGTFRGVGVYALYYKGRFELYSEVAGANQTQCTVPIYVGKAVPQGWRTARSARVENSSELQGRLQEHARSITQGKKLSCRDFSCRFMILQNMEMDLIGSIEAQLIRRFHPIWNVLIDGFGNHDPGAGRRAQSKSEWDVLHPGRPWARRLVGESPDIAHIVAKLKKAR